MRFNTSYQEIEQDNENKSVLFVDVRSPKEYAKATIPGAVNIPVLTNEERHEVGTLYVSGKVDEAKAYGMKAISPRLPEIFQQYQEYVKNHDQVVIFCSRGGFRSHSIFSLLKSLGVNVYKLEGGYKGYRRGVNEELPHLFEKIQFITLYGNTGSGKTAILKELKQLGANVLDLEACANHRGSLLGSVGLEAPHSQKMFESFLFDAAKQWKKPLIVFTEGESKRIGKAILPPFLVEAMRRGTDIKVESSVPNRVAQIKKDYLYEDQEELLEALDQLKLYVNAERVEEYKKQVRQQQYDTAIEDLLLKYYDPRYNHTKREYAADFWNESSSETAEAILKWVKSKKHSLL